MYNMYTLPLMFIIHMSYIFNLSGTSKTEMEGSGKSFRVIDEFQFSRAPLEEKYIK